MSQPQVLQRPSAANAVGRRRIEREGVSRSNSQSWRLPARTSSTTSSQGAHHGTLTTGATRSGELQATRGGDETFHEPLVYLHTCLIGQHVEVQKVNGHVYSGIFHAAIVEDDFGVILKMARLLKDGVRGMRSESARDAVRKPPIKTYAIHAKDFVQIVAKDVSLSGDALAQSRTRENRADIVTDAVFSHGRPRELERELKPWKPDDDAFENLSLNCSSTWSRDWDQFEANKALFGVETTFNEEFYTTRLERGPQMRSREREAQRIAQEIEGQHSCNTHLAEERGSLSSPDVESMDEERRYSSVLREERDRCESDDDYHIDVVNDETFGGKYGLLSVNGSGAGRTCTFTADEVINKCSRPSSGELLTESGVLTLDIFQDRRSSSIEKSDLANLDGLADSHKEHLRLRQLVVGDKSKHRSKGPGSPYNSPLGRGSPLLSPLVGDPTGIQALNLDPSCPQLHDDVYREFKEFKQQKQLEALKAINESFKKEIEPRSPRTAGIVVSVGQSAAAVSTLVNLGLSYPTLTPSSSSVSLALKKSTLNFNAKDFKLNPNAKVFTPSLSTPRPESSLVQSPSVFQGSICLQSSLSPPTAIQGMPVNMQYMQQNQAVLFPQCNSSVAIAAVVPNHTAYMQTLGSSVPGFPAGGVSGGGMPGQNSMRLPLQSHQQVVGPFGGVQQQIRYSVQPAPMQSGFMHPNNHLYPQHVMYGQSANQVLYVPLAQGSMQGQPLPSAPQGHLQRHRSGVLQFMQYGGSTSLSGQQPRFQQPLIGSHKITLAAALVPVESQGFQPAQGVTGTPVQSGPNGTGRIG